MVIVDQTWPNTLLVPGPHSVRFCSSCGPGYTCQHISRGWGWGVAPAPSESDPWGLLWDRVKWGPWHANRPGGAGGLHYLPSLSEPQKSAPQIRTPPLTLLAEAKVCNLDIALGVQKQIVQLQVPVRGGGSSPYSSFISQFQLGRRVG